MNTHKLVRLCGPQQYIKTIKYTKYTKTKFIYKFTKHKYAWEMIFLKFSKCRNSENMVFSVYRSNQGLGWSLSNRGDEISMCQFKEIDF